VSQSINSEAILQQMLPVFRSALDSPDLILKRELDASAVPTWDSLNHINLIVSLETEFGFEFDTAEIAGLRNVGEMADLIVTKLIAKN